MTAKWVWAASISIEVWQARLRAVLFPAFPLGRELSLGKDVTLLKPQRNNSSGRNRHRALDTAYFCNKAEQKPPPSNLFSFEKQKALLKILNHFHHGGGGEPGCGPVNPGEDCGVANEDSNEGFCRDVNGHSEATRFEWGLCGSMEMGWKKMEFNSLV